MKYKWHIICHVTKHMKNVATHFSLKMDMKLTFISYEKRNILLLHLKICNFSVANGSMNLDERNKKGYTVTFH